MGHKMRNKSWWEKYKKNILFHEQIRKTILNGLATKRNLEQVLELRLLDNKEKQTSLSR